MDLFTDDTCARLDKYATGVDDAYGQPGRTSLQRPTVIFLPGLGGEDDPVLEKFWQPVSPVLNVITLRYLDWTELVDTGCDFSVLFANVKQQIESLVPTGPLYITGYSIGGPLAYAVALDFEAAGRHVQSVSILDGDIYPHDSPLPFYKKVLRRIDELREYGPRSWLASFIAKVVVRFDARWFLHWLARYRNTPLPLRFEIYLHHTLTMHLTLRNFPQWWHDVLKPESPSTTPTLLFRSEEHEPHERQDLGWGAICMDLKVIPVTGSHRGMFEGEDGERLRTLFLETVSAAQD